MCLGRVGSGRANLKRIRRKIRSISVILMNKAISSKMMMVSRSAMAKRVSDEDDTCSGQ